MKHIQDDDAKVLMAYFERRRLNDPNFFYTCSVTVEGCLENIFGADGRGKAAYRYFHDVIVLDSTYIKNK